MHMEQHMEQHRTAAAYPYLPPLWALLSPSLKLDPKRFVIEKPPSCVLAKSAAHRPLQRRRHAFAVRGDVHPPERSGEQLACAVVAFPPSLLHAVMLPSSQSGRCVAFLLLLA